MDDTAEFTRARRALRVHPFALLGLFALACVGLYLLMPETIRPALLGSDQLPRLLYLIISLTMLAVLAVVAIIQVRGVRPGSRAPSTAPPSLFAWSRYASMVGITIWAGLLLVGEGVVSLSPLTGVLATLAVIVPATVAAVAFFVARYRSMNRAYRGVGSSQDAATQRTDIPCGGSGQQYGVSRFWAGGRMGWALVMVAVIVTGGTVLAVSGNPGFLLLVLFGAALGAALVLLYGARWTVVVSDAGVTVCSWPRRWAMLAAAGQIVRAEAILGHPGQRGTENLPTALEKTSGLPVTVSPSGGFTVRVRGNEFLRVVEADGTDLLVSTPDARALAATVNDLLARRVGQYGSASGNATP